MSVIARSRDFDSLSQPWKPPFWTFATVNGQNSRQIGPFLSQRAYSPDVFVFEKTRILRPNFSLLIEMIGSQVVVSMFTHCSRRPPILNLLGCHARFDLPECQ